ncbi:MAG: helix-turn-helix transcriptional regulator [Novosphingobium sp.]|nr:helix-turn-helix transcriptional regulator [Novosphingobium sp.]
MLEHYDAAVLKIHEAALEPACWGEALQAVADATGSAGAVMRVLSHSCEQRTFAYVGGITLDQVAGYDAACGASCPRQAYARANPGPTIRCDALILDECEMDRNPVYDWFRSNGLRYFLGTTLARTPEREIFFNVQRTARQGHVQQADIALFERFLPHLRHAIRVGGLLGTLDPPRRLSRWLLDRLPSAAFVLDTAGNVIMINERAEHMAAANDALTVVAGRLQTRSSGDRPVIDRMLAKALSGRAGGGFRLTRASGRAAYLGLIHPIDPGHALVSGEPAALLVLSDPANPAVAAPELLRALFGLTETESRVAALIATGAPTDNAAARLGMALETARVHLKNIYRKMEVAGRDELIAIVARLG